MHGHRLHASQPIHTWMDGQNCNFQLHRMLSKIRLLLPFSNKLMDGRGACGLVNWCVHLSLTRWVTGFNNVHRPKYRWLCSENSHDRFLTPYSVLGNKWRQIIMFRWDHPHFDFWNLNNGTHCGNLAEFSMSKLKNYQFHDLSLSHIHYDQLLLIMCNGTIQLNFQCFKLM